MSFTTGLTFSLYRPYLFSLCFRLSSIDVSCKLKKCIKMRSVSCWGPCSLSFCFHPAIQRKQKWATPGEKEGHIQIWRSELGGQESQCLGLTPTHLFPAADCGGPSLPFLGGNITTAPHRALVRPHNPQVGSVQRGHNSPSTEVSSDSLCNDCWSCLKGRWLPGWVLSVPSESPWHRHMWKLLPMYRWTEWGSSEYPLSWLDYSVSWPSLIPQVQGSLEAS
jgi:hypothetical protein